MFLRFHYNIEFWEVKKKTDEKQLFSAKSKLVSKVNKLTLAVFSQEFSKTDSYGEFHTSMLCVEVC